MTYAVTHSGNYINLLDPKPEQIDIEDIAQQLSHQYRWNGAGAYKISVLKHSLNVWYACLKLGGTPLEQLQALLHDATETYMSDLVSPLKHMCGDYKELEERLHNVIMNKYGLPDGLPDTIKEIDARVANTESYALFGDSRTDPDNKKYWAQLDKYTPITPNKTLYHTECIYDVDSMCNTFLSTFYNLTEHLAQ